MYDGSPSASQRTEGDELPVPNWGMGVIATVDSDKHYLEAKSSGSVGRMVLNRYAGTDELDCVETKRRDSDPFRDDLKARLAFRCRSRASSPVSVLFCPFLSPPSSP